MKALLLLFVLLLPGLALAQADSTAGTLDALNDKYGFRDATFEKPLSAFKGLTYRGQKGREVTYVRKTDKLTIGEFQVDEILYRFYNGLLSDISISTHGKKNVSGIIQSFAVAYGAPVFKDTSFSWTSTRVLMIGTVDEDVSRTTIVMSSVPLLYKKKEQALKDADAQHQKRIKSVIKGASDL